MTSKKQHSHGRGVERGSIEKVLKIIKKSFRPLTPSEIASRTSLQVSSVRSCLDFLERLGIIIVFKGGRTWLVKLKNETQN